MRPAKLSSVWSVGAAIQIMTPEGHWRTVASCMDCPNPIARELARLPAELVADGVWVKTTTCGEYVGREFWPAARVRKMIERARDEKRGAAKQG